MGTSCLICNSKNRTLKYDLTNPGAHKGIGLTGLIYQCNECNFLYKEYTAKIEEIYADEYADSMLSLNEYFNKDASLFFGKIIKNAISHLPPDKRSNLELLDIGCGAALVLDAGQAAGINVTGVELSKKLAEISKSKGHKVFNCDIADVKETENNKYDIITMMDIIEHLDDPGKILMSVRRFLKDSGVLVVYTPNHNSMLVKVADVMFKFGIKSPVENIFACTHTGFFTKNSIERIKQQSGYSNHKIEFSIYDISRPGQQVSVFAKPFIYAIEKIGIMLGYGGFRMVTYIKK